MIYHEFYISLDSTIAFRKALIQQYLMTTVLGLNELYNVKKCHGRITTAAFREYDLPSNDQMCLLRLAGVTSYKTLQCS